MSRSAVDWSSGRKANYKEFCKNYPTIKLTFAEWKSIIYAFNDEFRIYILETGEKAKMPVGLGEFAITKKKRQRYAANHINLPVDWKKTQEKGKLIYNFNYHTEGFFFGWKWFRPATSFLYTKLWSFKPARMTSRLINHYITTSPKYMHLYKEWGSVSK